MSNAIADYKPEREAFKTLFLPECSKRILMFCGASGSGKTTLVNHCLENVPEAVQRIPIQLRANAVGIAEILSRTGYKLGWQYLQNFTEQVAIFQGAPLWIDSYDIRNTTF